MEPTECYHRIITLLTGVEYETFEHEHVHRSEDAARVRGTKLEEAAKALVLQAGSGKVFMCVVSGHRKLDLKKVKALVGERNVSLAHPDVVLRATGCPIGTVPPFGNLFGLDTYVDRDVLSRERIVFSAGSHHHSVRMRAEDWWRVVQPHVADIGTSSNL